MRFSIKALGIGYLISFIGVAIFSLLNNLFTLLHLPGPFGASSIETQLLLSYFFFGLNLLVYMLAGYVCAKIAKREEILHGIILGIIIWILSTLIIYITYFLFQDIENFLNIQTVLSLFLPVLFCLLGAFIRKRTNDKIRETNEPSLEQKIKNLGNN